MPRRFEDGKVVQVYYSTRCDAFRLLGKIDGFNEGKYKVRMLAYDLDNSRKYYYWYHRKRRIMDTIVLCNANEIGDVLSTDATLGYYLAIAQKQWNEMVKYFTDDHNAGANFSLKTETFAYNSFALKRLLDGDLDRRYHLTETKRRNQYVI